MSSSSGDSPRRLCGMELATVLTDEYSPFNVVCALHLRPAPPLESIRSAFAALQVQHPLLSTRLVKKSGHYCYEKDPGHEVPVELVDADHPQRWSEEVERHLNTAIDRSAAPLIRATLVNSPEADHPATLVLSIHHSIIDGASLANFLHELLTLIGSGGESAEAPTPLPDQPPLTQILPTDFRGIALRARLAMFLARQMADEFFYRWKSRGQRLATPERGWCRVHSFAFDRAETGQIVTASRRRRTPLNALLNAALLLAAQDALYPGRARVLRYFTFADLRPYVDPPLPPQHLGTYVSMLRYTTPMPTDDSLETLATAITQQILTSSKRGDKFLGALMSPHVIRAMVRFEMDRMGTTALSHSGPVTVAPTYGDIEVEGLHAYVSNFDRGPSLAAQTRILHGRLIVDLLYLDTELDRDRITGVADKLRLSLTEFGAAGPEKGGESRGTEP
ncbi:MAG: hypothetical protein GY906_15085 [bacterium]|nr:hypothetical protein [bacterium]